MICRPSLRRWSVCSTTGVQPVTRLLLQPPTCWRRQAKIEETTAGRVGRDRARHTPYPLTNGLLPPTSPAAVLAGSPLLCRACWSKVYEANIHDMMKQMPAQRERRKRDFERVLTLFASDSLAKDRRNKVGSAT